MRGLLLVGNWQGEKKETRVSYIDSLPNVHFSMMKRAFFKMILYLSFLLGSKFSIAMFFKSLLTQCIFTVYVWICELGKLLKKKQVILLTRQLKQFKNTQPIHVYNHSRESNTVPKLILVSFFNSRCYKWTK